MVEQSTTGATDERAQVRVAWRAHFDELYRRLDTEIAALAQEVTPWAMAPSSRPASGSARSRCSASDRAGPVGRARAGPGSRARRRYDHAAEQELYQELVAHFRPAPAARVTRPVPTAGAQAAPLIVGPPVWKDLVTFAQPAARPARADVLAASGRAQGADRLGLQPGPAGDDAVYRQRTVGNGQLTASRTSRRFRSARASSTASSTWRGQPPRGAGRPGRSHGCYSCSRPRSCSPTSSSARGRTSGTAALPDVKLVFLATTSTRAVQLRWRPARALQLFVAMPDQVILLRVTRVADVVRQPHLQRRLPAEALASIEPYVPIEMLEAYRQLFESMPPRSSVSGRCSCMAGSLARTASRRASTTCPASTIPRCASR